MDSDLLKDISIPVFTGVIGYIINWTGVWMLFRPTACRRRPRLPPPATLG